MKKPTLPLCISGGLLTAAGLIWLFQSPELPADKAPSLAGAQTPTASFAQRAQSLPGLTGDDTLEAVLVSRGQLWEPHAQSSAEARRSYVAVRPDAFAPVRQARKGERIELELAAEIPALEGTVTHTTLHPDGTRVTHLRIPGDPEGELIIQENEAYDFFLGQLYYEDEPVAYEFKESNQGLLAQRHPVSNLICSIIGQEDDSVAMGLPGPDIAKAPGGNGGGKPDGGGGGGGGGGKPGGDGGGDGGPTISVSDASVTEGTGSSNTLLNFTLRLSSSDKNNSIFVEFATSDATATAGEDYLASRGTAEFPPRARQITVSVPVLSDADVEGNETFTLTLSNPVGATVGTSSATGTILDDDAPPLVPALNSLPGATAVAYLDMDGEIVSGSPWNGGRTIVARGIDDTFTDAQMTEIWERTAEDFAPFNINITTEESVYLAAPSNRRIRCIITPDNEWFGSAGGVAYLNSFTWTDDTPCWVFSDMLGNHPPYIAEASSHEIGHTLGLYHDGRTSPSEGYYQGHGGGVTGWAPIMGVGYYKSLVQWSKGEYANANNTEDDLAIITSRNGFGYRSDDHGNTPGSASSLVVSNTSLSGSGLIESENDADVFSFTVGKTGPVSFTVESPTISPNLDILAEIRTSNGQLITSDNDPDLLKATVTTTLDSGTYYLRVQGTGKGDSLGDGYSAYGSLGPYTISGQAP